MIDKSPLSSGTSPMPDFHLNLVVIVAPSAAPHGDTDERGERLYVVCAIVNS